MASLYERLGGDVAIEKAVDIFYDRLLDDPDVGHFFINSDIPNLRRKQMIFMAYVFGKHGPNPGVDLRHAHTNVVMQGLDHGHYGIVADHLRETLEGLGVPDPEVQEVVAILESVRMTVLGKA